jgi:hypothetical protein
MTYIRFLIYYFALVLCFAVDVVNAQPYGIANLALCKYTDVAIEGHPAGFANVTFTNTFCDAYDSIDRLLATGKVPFQEYNLAWRDNHVFKISDFPSIVKEAEKYAKLAEKHPNVKCAFSGATEHQLNKKDATDLARLVLAVIPERCIYVNNPWTGKGAFIDPGPRIWNEVHGAEASPPKVGGKYIFNFDGSDAFDYVIWKVLKRVPGAEIYVFWTSQNNGRLNKNDKTPRPLRKAYPVVKLLKALAFLAYNQGVGRLPNSKYLIKPKADQHESPEPEDRALKPVFIFPIDAERIELWANGKKIITSSISEPFVDGRRRFYFAEFGWEIVKRAGRSILDVMVGKKKIGTANPGTRQ